MRTGDSFSPGTERPWFEVNLSPPYNAEVKNEWCYTCTHSEHLTGTLLHTSTRVYGVIMWIIFGIMTSNLVCCIAVLTAVNFLAIFVSHWTYICFKYGTEYGLLECGEGPFASRTTNDVSVKGTSSLFYWHAFVINETGPSVSRRVTAG